MRRNILTVIARIAERRPGLVFIGALLVTAIAVGLASQLRLTTHFKDMLPQGHPVEMAKKHTLRGGMPGAQLFENGVALEVKPRRESAQEPAFFQRIGP